jgi:hypothetical protein
VLLGLLLVERCAGALALVGLAPELLQPQLLGRGVLAAPGWVSGASGVGSSPGSGSGITGPSGGAAGSLGGSGASGTSGASGFGISMPATLLRILSRFFGPP